MTTALHSEERRYGGVGAKRRIRVTLGAYIVITTCVAALVATLLVGCPAWRQKRRAEQCIENLRVINWAKDQYAVEFGGGGETFSPSYQTGNVAVYLTHLDAFVCPLAEGTNRTFVGSYRVNGLTDVPTCLICPELHWMENDYDNGERTPYWPIGDDW